MRPPIPAGRKEYPQEIDAAWTPLCVQLLRPQEHQLRGVGVILHRMFRRSLNDPRVSFAPYPGPPAVTLHADAMGLGKTYQTFLTIALLAHYRDLQARGQPLPDFFREHRFFTPPVPLD